MASKKVLSIEITSGGGSWNIFKNVDSIYVYSTGEVTLSGAVIIDVLSTPVKNTEIIIDYKARLIAEEYAIVVFGRTLTQAECLMDLKMFCRYDEDLAAWVVIILPANTFVDGMLYQSLTVPEEGGVIDLYFDKRHYLITGSVTLLNNYSIIYSSAPQDGRKIYFTFNASIVPNGFTVTILGRTLTDFELSCGGGLSIIATYIEDSTSWDVLCFVDSSIIENVVSDSHVYRALLNQSRTNDPVPTILENTLGNIIWTRQNTGKYRGTLASSFPPARTYLSIAPQTHSVDYMIESFTDYILVSTWDDNVNDYNDTLLINVSVEIRVYSPFSIVASASSSPSSSISNSPSSSVSPSVSLSASPSSSESPSASISNSPSSSISPSVSESESVSASPSRSISVSPSVSESASPSSSISPSRSISASPSRSASVSPSSSPSPGS